MPSPWVFFFFFNEKRGMENEKVFSLRDVNLKSLESFFINFIFLYRKIGKSQFSLTTNCCLFNLQVRATINRGQEEKGTTQRVYRPDTISTLPACWYSFWVSSENTDNADRKSNLGLSRRNAMEKRKQIHYYVYVGGM